jgi:glycerophosphoryl diester phosphodiesterase
MRQVLNIAHRGGAGLRPENTIAAFAHAIALGADGAELDVQLSRDGEVVVFHDHRLKPEICRTRDGSWIKGPSPAVHDLSLAELRGYDVGRADPGTDYARRHGLVRAADGERIPTLGEVIGLAKGARKAFVLLIELKTSLDPEGSAGPAALAQATIDVVRRHEFLDRAIFVGFDWRALLHVRTIAPESRCWFTTYPESWFREEEPPKEDSPPSSSMRHALRHWATTGTSPWAAGHDAIHHGGSILRAIKEAGGAGWFPYFRDLTEERAAEARALGLRLGAWTVDASDDMRRLLAFGIDAICTDRPDLLAELA